MIQNQYHYMRARVAVLTKHFALFLRFPLDKRLHAVETVGASFWALALQKTEGPGADHAEPRRFWIGGYPTFLRLL